MTMTSLNNPAISEAGVKRLFAFTDPKRLTEHSTLFTAGYEEAKRDMRERLIQETGRPTNDVQSVERAADTHTTDQIVAMERRARKEMSSPRRWWSL